MHHVHDVLRDRLLRRAGLVTPPPARYRLADLEVTEWAPGFERLMRNRLIMGALRYGTLECKRRGGHRWDLLGAIEKKTALYHATGNTEYLVDIANYCLLEFECGTHPLKHFSATDDTADHCRAVTPTAEHDRKRA
jgi:hypothetical protein